MVEKIHGMENGMGEIVSTKEVFAYSPEHIRSFFPCNFFHLHDIRFVRVYCSKEFDAYPRH